MAKPKTTKKTTATTSKAKTSKKTTTAKKAPATKTKPNTAKKTTTKTKPKTAKKTTTKTKPKTAKKTTTKKKPAPLQMLPPKSKAEEMCEHVTSDIKPQAVTLANAVLTIQAKIEQQIPIYREMPLAQQVTVGTGERMLRANPATQEFRATVRDYATALNCLNEILTEKKAPSEGSPLDDLRNRFGVG